LARYSRGMRPQGSPEELERRRRRGIELLKAGATVTEVARQLGCSHSSVILWREAVRRRGLKALTAKPAPGRPPKLTAAQQRQLPRLLLRGATTWAYETDLWTTGRDGAVIHPSFGVGVARAPPSLRRAIAPGSCGPATHHARLVVPETRAARRRTR